MRVCVLTPELRPSGGLSVVLRHAERLREAGGFTIDLVSAGAAASADEHVLSLSEAREERYDVALATWWETVPLLSQIHASRRAVFVQSAEERFYPDTEPLERLGAALSLCAPVHFITVARWLQRFLEELRPDCRCWYVPNGIDKALFAPVPRSAEDRPLRIMIEGQHTLWFKGVAEALEAVGAMTEPREVTLVSLDPDGAPAEDGVRVLGGLGREAMRDQYMAHDVLLKLSRVESLGLPLVEAAHVGTPAVVTPYTGHDEVVRHGETGIVVGFDDPAACAAALDSLARDRARLAALGEGARASMTAWPSEDEAADAFAGALRELAGAPEPSAAATAAFARWRAAAETGRVQRSEAALRHLELQGSLSWLEQGLAEARRAYDELSKSRDEAAELIAERDEWLRARDEEAVELHERAGDLHAESAAMRASPAVRAAMRLDRAVDRLRRR